MSQPSSSPAGGPRKVAVGTCIYPMYAAHNLWPGLEGRLAQLAELIDGMAACAEADHGCGLDLAVLPEVAVNGGLEGDAATVSFALEGPVLERMGAAARRHGCYVVVPLFLREADGGTCTNAAVLVDRFGQVAGIYRKVFPVSAYDKPLLEGGVTPGTTLPVFACDFGRVGLQICFDVAYEDGWAALGAAGAELVCWPTMSPQTVQPAAYARRHRYWLVSSTWRNNATVFYPDGQIAAQIHDPERLLVHRLDLSYALLGWQPTLGNGAALTQAFGDAVGYHYSEAEDGGVFWSNDPARPIDAMVRQLGLETMAQVVARNRQLQDRMRPGPIAV